jgi:drug/metabolite transporter (DMT)-like permease
MGAPPRCALPVSPLRTITLTVITLVFFAANSVLGRVALGEGAIDAGLFTAIRLLSGAVVLAALVALHGGGRNALERNGFWMAAFTLVAYAVTFSYAYLSLDAGVGALILFAFVQIIMIGFGILRGERPRLVEWIGLAAALAGLVYLLLPGITAPPLVGAAAMAISGVGWGWYSLLARGVESPIATTASNFVRTVPACLVLLVAVWSSGTFHATAYGLRLAVVCGAITSGLGYAIWYAALKGLTATRAVIVQLCVPVIAATGGVLFVDEQLTPTSSSRLRPFSASSRWLSPASAAERRRRLRHPAALIWPRHDPSPVSRHDGC